MEISPVFLVLSLFLPRIALIIWWFMNAIPFNTVPFWGEVLLTIFIPRVLILIYIAENMGTDSPWFWVHLVVAVLVYIFGGKKAANRKG
jgi:hypothetical protein